MSQPEVLLEKVIWQPVVDGRTHDVEINVWHHPEALDQPFQTHFYPGLGEEDRIAQRGVKKLAALDLPASVVVLPVQSLPVTAANIDRFATEAPIAVAQAMNEKAGKPADQPVDLMGRSQGGGIIFMTASHDSEQYGSLAALSPVGLNPDDLGRNPSQKRRNFMWRLGWQNNRRPEQSLRDPGNIVAGYEVFGRIGSDVLHRRLGTKLDYALSVNLGYRIQRLAADHPIRIFVGEHDPIFRYHELALSLGELGMVHLLEEVSGSHSSLAAKATDSQLAVMVDWLKSLDTTS
jgi:surfactin synthase thioesterase subunit